MKNRFHLAENERTASENLWIPAKEYTLTLPCHLCSLRRLKYIQYIVECISIQQTVIDTAGVSLSRKPVAQCV